MQVHRRIETRTRLTIDNQWILRKLREDNPNIPTDAEITFRVPGGGDWSNMDVDIDQRNPIQVAFKEIVDETPTDAL